MSDLPLIFKTYKLKGKELKLAMFHKETEKIVSDYIELVNKDSKKDVLTDFKTDLYNNREERYKDLDYNSWEVSSVIGRYINQIDAYSNLINKNSM